MQTDSYMEREWAREALTLTHSWMGMGAPTIERRQKVGGQKLWYHNAKALVSCRWGWRAQIHRATCTHKLNQTAAERLNHSGCSQHLPLEGWLEKLMHHRQMTARWPVR